MIVGILLIVFTSRSINKELAYPDDDTLIIVNILKVGRWAGIALFILFLLAQLDLF